MSDPPTAEAQAPDLPAVPGTVPGALDVDRLRGLEAVLFLAERPLDVVTLSAALECAPMEVEPLLEELGQRLVERQSGLVLRNVAGGWRMYTAAETREYVERHVLAGKSGRLSQAALETLAVIAYKQPISRTEVGEVRGVNADGAVRSLVARGLIEEVGRDDGPGQAVLYGTTSEFLEKIGLESIDDLPPLTDFLVENPAPDEPTPDQLKEARRRLQSGRELSSTGSARWDPDSDAPAEQDTEAAAERAADRVRDSLARAMEQRREAAARRREQDAEMDELTGALERVAASAIAQLRHVAAVEEELAEEESGDEPGDVAGPGEQP